MPQLKCCSRFLSSLFIAGKNHLVKHVFILSSRHTEGENLIVNTKWNFKDRRVISMNLEIRTQKEGIEREIRKKTILKEAQ
jgi:hypothetical protein